MKLILSSCDFRNEKSKKTIIDNLSKPIDQCKLLFIPKLILFYIGRPLWTLKSLPEC